MIRSGFACLMLFACAGPASAQLAVQELKDQFLDLQSIDLFALGQGDLFLHVRGQRNFIYLLAPDGNIKERTESPQEAPQHFVPYRNGVAVQQLTQILEYERTTDVRPKLLYESRAPFHSPRLYAAPDGQDLYVIEAGVQSQITRIDSSGQIAWQTSTTWIEPASFVTTDNGVAFAQNGSTQNSPSVLRAIDREGRQRWEVPWTSRVSHESIYSPAGFIVMPTYGGSGNRRDQQRVKNFDAGTGQLTADVLVDPFLFALGTKDGLLVAGEALGRAYVATLDRKGKYVWLRRYAADQRTSDIRQGVMTGDGKLVFVTHKRAGTTLTATTSVVVTDGTAAALSTVRGGCLDARWGARAELLSRLRERGFFVVPPDDDWPKPTKEQGCTARELQFIAFTEGLAATLPPELVRSAESPMILVEVKAAGEPIRLEGYSWNRENYEHWTWGASGGSLLFAALYDGAQEFSNIVSNQVWPHLDRMQGHQERFVQMTGFHYSTFDDSHASMGRVLTELEKAARVVNQTIAKIAPDELAAIRGESARRSGSMVLRRASFGTGVDGMRPLAMADRTLLDIVRGDIAMSPQVFP